MSLAKSEAEYRAAVLEFLNSRDDGTLPERGWPWPWNDSNTTDYAYTWDNGTVWHTIGYEPSYWWESNRKEPSEDDIDEQMASALQRTDFPDMRSKQKVVRGQRSGLFVISNRAGG